MDKKAITSRKELSDYDIRADIENVMNLLNTLIDDYESSRKPSNRQFRRINRTAEVLRGLQKELILREGEQWLSGKS